MTRQPTHHGYAVNVKDQYRYSLDTEPLTEGEVQSLYDQRAEDFWDLVQEVGTDHGYRAVYSEGRMSGYAVPEPQPSPDSVGPRIAYIPEGDMPEWERNFRSFETEVLALMEACREEFLADLAAAVERAKAEPAERAHWAARDVITEDRS